RHPPCAPADRVLCGGGVGALQEVGGRGLRQLLGEERQRSTGEELDLDAFETLPRCLYGGGMLAPFRRAGIEDEAPAARSAGLDARQCDLERLAQGVSG